jgi:Ca2+/Na+ antiporter
MRVARGPRLREGLHATIRVIVLALAMDVIYQVISFGEFYPVEAAVVVFVLAFAPYLLMRGPAARLARRWLAHQSTKPRRTA